MMQFPFRFGKKDQMVLGATLLVVIIAGAVWWGVARAPESEMSLASRVFPFLGGGSKATAQKAIDYLNKNVLKDGQSAVLGTVTDESGIIKLQVKIGENTYDSYVTADGKLFFAQAFMLNEPLPAAK